MVIGWAQIVHRINQGAYVVWIDRRLNAVAQVEYMPAALAISF